MQSLVSRLHAEYNELMQKISSVSDTLLAMNEHAGADATDSVRNAGYVVYAYLGGQAKREITYMAEQ